jgi:hypothetical protein
MKMANHTSVLHPRSEKLQKKLHTLRVEQRRWNSAVCHELGGFATRHWRRNGWLRWLGLPGYRLRRQLEDDGVTWWVERDIPPADRFRCAAYRVYLHLDTKMNVALSVQSGQKNYPVVPVNSENLRAVLSKAVQDSPLIIARQMGDALDP